ncbi:hypothetical protein SCLCIDRAFT_30844 [Scleroderma citrinum Foug A]|uniref:Uncharacterized protein n=1 Tax=Scleroderma citrinum Foug A TaxID=1036808 RepID=A0A0C3D1T8_9AGAM|nr:hypothetical protein SCLCIDRAFT_30844 [Scleroderma citrinum Foug A]
MSAICKFNNYCALLEELYNLSYAIPLPTLLPTKLAELHNDQTLLEDVWITCSEGEVPLWLKDPDVRSAIQAMLKLDHCHEEQLRLGMEADNLCRWFGHELCMVEFALRQPQYSIFHLILKQRHENICALQEQWPSPLVSAACYASEAHSASKLAASLSGSSAMNTLQWLSPILCELPVDGQVLEAEDPETIMDMEYEDPGQIALSDHLLNQVSNDIEGSVSKDEDKEPMQILFNW